MCGIAGVYSVSDSRHSILEKNANKLIHRGPDFQKTEKINENLSFFHSRLSIVDLNPRSNQPFHDLETGNSIIFNGEIYNYKELQELIPNRNFRTSSDTEVLLYLISDLGIDQALENCNGMFSFAFWNNELSCLTLGRDRLGQKPLFYFHNGEFLAFASEAKLLLDFVPTKNVNHKAVVNYLFEIVVGGNDYSFFESIIQLKNATYKTFKLKGKKVEEISSKRYWSYPKETKHIDYDKAVIEFRDLLKDSINLRLADEVDYAVMLSGGLDSSSISSFSALNNPSKEITSISAVYPGDEKDESHFAKLVTEKYKNLKPLWIDNIDHKEFEKNIENVIYHLECPLADGSLIAQNSLMNRIKDQGIKVILSGNGGDEILAGYPAVFHPSLVANNLKKGKIRRLSLRALIHLLPSKLKNYIYVWKHKRLNLLNDNSYLKLLNPRFNDYNKNDLVNSYLINGLELWTLPNLMWYEDRNSMSASIESRCPFLDYRLVEFLLSLPGEYKINSNFTKRILRDSMKGIVPDAILERKDKQGFHAPNDVWVKYIDENFLMDKAFRNEFDYINFDVIKSSPFRTYWRVYTLYLWYKIFFK